MDLKERNDRIRDFFREAEAILIAKGKDYNPTGIAFEDIKQTAKDLGVVPEKVLWVFMTKHIAAVRSYIEKGAVASEPVDGRLKDLANYCAMMAVLIGDKNLDKVFEKFHRNMSDEFTKPVLGEPTMVYVGSGGGSSGEALLKSELKSMRKNWSKNKKTYISLERKKKFLEQRPNTAKLAFHNYDTSAKAVLCKSARRELGYSKGTRDSDILRLLAPVWEGV